MRDLIFLIIGLIGGWVGNYYFYRKQASQTDTISDLVVAALDRNYEQALRNGVKHASTIHAVREIDVEVGELGDLVTIRNKMDSAYRELKTSTAEEGPTLSQMHRFKALGDRWSELASVDLNLRILEEDGRIELDRVIAVHKNIFPDNFPWAGKFRTDHVTVVENFGTVTRVVDTVPAESKFQPIAPEHIDENLARLISHWNSSIDSLVDRDPKVKIDEVANFHHEFELVHPFLDGNGRIGRMLLEEQLSLLFQCSLKFGPDRTDYYHALRMMNVGEKDHLKELIQDELGKFNVAL